MLVIELGERGVGGLEACTEHAALIGAAKLVRPDRVGLVFEHLTAHQRERLLERAREPWRSAHPPTARSTRRSGRGRARRGLVAKRYASASVTTSWRARSRSSARCRRRTETKVWRSRRVLWPAVAPEKLGDPLGRHAMPACREQDLEHLLRPRSSEVAGTERARDRRRSRALRRAGSSGGRKIGLLP